MSFLMQRIAVVSSNASDLASLLNVADEQLFLLQSLSSEAFEECLQGDTNLARVQILCAKVVKDLVEGNAKIYDALCEYLMMRSEAYQFMHQRLTAHRSTNSGRADGRADSELLLLQKKVNSLTEEIAYLRSLEKVPRKYCKISEVKETMMNLIQKVSNDLSKENRASFQQLQTSLETVIKAVAHPLPFPYPHSDEMRAKVAVTVENLNYWKQFRLQFLPFLCDENGEYFVDWDNNDLQWKFGKYGKKKWRKNLGGDAEASYVNLVACSLLLPRQFNVDGMNERGVNVFFNKTGTSLLLYMAHQYSSTPNVTSTRAKCQFCFLVKHSDGSSLMDLREKIVLNLSCFDLRRFHLLRSQIGKDCMGTRVVL